MRQKREFSDIEDKIMQNEEAEKKINSYWITRGRIRETIKQNNIE